MSPKIVAFTGLDGCGKTTHVKALRDYLKMRGLKVISFHQFESIIFRFPKMNPFIKKLHLYAATPGTVEFQYSLNNKEKSTFLRFVAAMYIIIFGLLRTWLKILFNLKYDIIIFDRYYIDELIRAKWKFKINFKSFRWICYLAPRPYKLFFLRISPEVAWQRTEQGEVAKNLFFQKGKDYIEWINWLKTHWNILDIDTDGKTFQQIQQTIRNNLLFTCISN